MSAFALRWWAPFVVSAGAALAILSLGPARDGTVLGPDAAFATVVALTAACSVAAAVVLAIGFTRRLGEVALLGAVLWAVSVLPLAHGLLLPGHLYGENPGTEVAAIGAVPAALLAGLPLLLDGTPLGRRLAHRWLAWSATWTVLVAAAALALLTWPGALPEPGGAAIAAIVATSLAGTAVLSLRHLRLFAIGRRAGSLVVSLGLIAPGLATIAFLGAEPLSAGWWLAHLVDGLGVLFAAAGLLWSHWRDRSLALFLAPVLDREPLGALQLGLTPVVHEFISALELKDAVTREHVVRVSEMAMRSGERAGLDPVELRAAGLGGLLHDVGKVLTPDAVLRKPAALSDAERAVVELHPVAGAEMLAPYPHLAEVAAVVRSHHERPDGQGYPDGAGASEIPPATAIVSAVDAWDAMVSDRPYREGMSPRRAESILREGAGTQWTAGAVEALLAEVRESGARAPSRLAGVGREAAARGVDGEGAEDALDACLPAEAAARARRWRRAIPAPGATATR